MNTHTAIALAAALLLGACASTPQAVMDQANDTVGMMGRLETAMAEFRRIEGHAEQARRDSMQRQMAAVDETQIGSRRDARARLSAGDRETGALIEQLVGDSDALGQDELDLAAAKAGDAATLDALATPLPSTAAQTRAAQKKLAAIGSELPLKTRAGELADFAAAIRKAVDENRQKIRDAEAAAH
jgi:hypothetical protein